ncbi:MAG TPA: hypothetical protein PLZ55_03905 [bacterium]|nr:hypothetical protein [bacterium]HPO07788.1 hypothetical protein [bacterium]HQO34513.1 hypothetical protein [bacterium]HQP99226.1 hypothetical protein [bacterium]
MKKTFDCVEMKRKAQERIYEEIRDLTPEKEIEYFHKAAEDFWKEIRSLRGDKQPEPARERI